MKTDLSRAGRLLTPREASAYLDTRWGIRRGINRLAQLRVSGEGPRFIKFERDIHYTVADLDEWVTSRATVHTHTPVRTASQS